MRRPSRAVWLAAAALAVVVLVVALADRRSPVRRGAPPDAPTTPQTSAPDTTTAPPEAPPPQEATPSPAPATSPVDDSRYARRNERVSNAISLLRYPPDSQPLTRDMRDVIEPNRRHESRMPISQSDLDIEFELTADVFTVVGHAPAHPTLKAFRGQTRLHVDVTSATLSTGTPVVFDDDGNATITDFGTAGRGLVRLDVDFTAERRASHASLDFRVASTVPATFTGVTGDRLVPEGLEVSVALEVREKGRYFIQGLLFDANDSPIGYAVARPQLEAGPATVPLVYFGLMFHDANANGPYVFRTLTGVRLPEGQEPDRADMETWAGPYQTAKYSLSEFQNGEYESPEKDAKIAALNALANGNRAR